MTPERLAEIRSALDGMDPRDRRTVRELLAHIDALDASLVTHCRWLDEERAHTRLATEVLAPVTEAARRATDEAAHLRRQLAAVLEQRLADDALTVEAAERRLRKPNDVPAHEVGKVRIVEEAVTYARNAGAPAAVLGFLAERHTIGMRRYGIPLTEATPIDARTYAIEEVADTVVYATLGKARGESWAVDGVIRDLALGALISMIEPEEESR